MKWPVMPSRRAGTKPRQRQNQTVNPGNAILSDRPEVAAVIGVRMVAVPNHLVGAQLSAAGPYLDAERDRLRTRSGHPGTTKAVFSGCGLPAVAVAASADHALHEVRPAPVGCVAEDDDLADGCRWRVVIDVQSTRHGDPLLPDHEHRDADAAGEDDGADTDGGSDAESD